MNSCYEWIQIDKKSAKDEEADDGTDTLLIFLHLQSSREKASVASCCCLEQQFAFRSATFVTRLEMQDMLRRQRCSALHRTVDRSLNEKWGPRFSFRATLISLTFDKDCQPVASVKVHFWGILFQPLAFGHFKPYRSLSKVKIKRHMHVLANHLQ